VSYERMKSNRVVAIQAYQCYCSRSGDGGSNLDCSITPVSWYVLSLSDFLPQSRTAHKLPSHYWVWWWSYNDDHVIHGYCGILGKKFLVTLQWTQILTRPKSSKLLMHVFNKFPSLQATHEFIGDVLFR